MIENLCRKSFMIMLLSATPIVSAVTSARASASDAAAGVSQSSGTLEAADQLYFHRNVSGNLERSISLLEDMNARDPGNPQVLWRLGRSLERRGERGTDKKEKLKLFDEARAALKQSIAKDRNFAESHFWLGVTLGRIGQTRGILKSLFLLRPTRGEMKRTLELDPRYGGAYRVLGEILRQIPAIAGGSKKGAVKEMERAVELNPNYTSNYVALGQAYLEYGRPEQARIILNKVFEVQQPADPGQYDDDVKDARRMLDAMEKKK